MFQNTSPRLTWEQKINIGSNFTNRGKPEKTTWVRITCLLLQIIFLLYAIYMDQFLDFFFIMKRWGGHLLQLVKAWYRYNARVALVYLT